MNKNFYYSKVLQTCTIVMGYLNSLYKYNNENVPHIWSESNQYYQKKMVKYM